MDRLFLNINFRYAYHTLVMAVREGGIQMEFGFAPMANNPIDNSLKRCPEKKTGAGGKSAPLPTKNLQGESMSIIEKQSEDRKHLRRITVACRLESDK